MTLRERMRSQIGHTVPRPVVVHWIESAIQAKLAHLTEIRNDPFFGEDDREWMRGIKLEIRRLRAEWRKHASIS